MSDWRSRWWLAPLWVGQLATGAKSFVDNPILGSAALNRRGLHALRLKIAHRLAWSRRRRLSRRIDAADRAAFDRDGYVRIDGLLPPDEFAQLREQLLSTEFDAREHRQGNAVTRRVAIDAQVLAQFPTLAGLLRNPRWRGLMQYVASCSGEPIYYFQTIITSPDGAPDPQVVLHSDSFQPSLKAWLFLTDVAEEAGPFTYVAGSHRLSPERLDWERRRSLSVLESGDRLSQRGSLRIGGEELAGLGLAQPMSFAVPANTLVVGDTFGFHARGPSLQSSVRVEIWAYRRRSPFLPWASFSLSSFPPLKHRRATMAWRIADWLDQRGWRQQHWKAVGKKRLDDPDVATS